MKTESTAKLVRIFLGESDRWKGQPLYVAIVEEMRKAGLSGATTFKGVLGFGAHSVVHAARIVDLSSDLPIVIELVDSDEKVEAFLPTLDAMVTQGLVTLETVRVIAYKAGVPK
jgi:PII-like signaling protein